MNKQINIPEQMTHCSGDSSSSRSDPHGEQRIAESGGRRLWNSFELTEM